ncbi:MAG: hypothetical protein ACK4I8_08600, partial [Armatimonadota bacterium]
ANWQIGHWQRLVMKVNWWRIVLIVIVCFGIILVVRNCLTQKQIFATEPSTIIRNPDKFNNKRVLVKGQVISALSIGGTGLYLLRDDKGTAITVVTYKDTPDVGALLVVRGFARKALQVGAASLVGIEEQSRTQVGFSEVKEPTKVWRISEVRDEAMRLNGQPILVVGTVQEGADILGTGYYILQDGEENLTVITGMGAPRIGKLVQVFGVYNRLAQIQGQTVDCLIELDRKTQ